MLLMKLLSLRQLLLLLHLMGESLLLEELGLALQVLHARPTFQLEGALLLRESAWSWRSISAAQLLTFCCM